MLSFIPLLAWVITIPSTQAQTVEAECGSAARSSILSDELYNSADVAGNILPAIRDTICPFGEDAYCRLEGDTCTFEATMETGSSTYVSITVSVTDEISAGQSGSLRPCPTVLDQLFSQCITNAQSPRTSGSARAESFLYSVNLSTGQRTAQEPILEQNDHVNFDATIPESVRNLLDGAPAPQDPPQTPPQQQPQCQTDCQALRPRVSAKARDGHICTDAPDTFVETGSSDADMSDFFVVDRENNCNVVVAKSAASRGHFGAYCFRLSDVLTLIDRDADKCTADPYYVQLQDGALPGQNQGSGVGMACIADGNNYKRCGAGVV